MQEIPFGGGAINDALIQFSNPSLPFGGRGGSGSGSYHGRYGFETFSHKKSVVEGSTLFDPPVRYPPYGGKLRWLKDANEVMLKTTRPRLNFHAARTVLKGVYGVEARRDRGARERARPELSRRDLDWKARLESREPRRRARDPGISKSSAHPHRAKRPGAFDPTDPRFTLWLSHRDDRKRPHVPAPELSPGQSRLRIRDLIVKRSSATSDASWAASIRRSKASLMTRRIAICIGTRNTPQPPSEKGSNISRALRMRMTKTKTKTSAASSSTISGASKRRSRRGSTRSRKVSSTTMGTTTTFLVLDSEMAGLLDFGDHGLERARLARWRTRPPIAFSIKRIRSTSRPMSLRAITRRGR